MTILALESSAKSVSCAVCSNDALLGQYFQNSGLTHSRTLLSMVESLLANLNMHIKDIELIAVSSGPGSFTGIRIGVAAAKGLAWGLDIPVCGISTLEAMARQSAVKNATICPVMDARRGQMYNAMFEWDESELVRKCPDRAIALDALASDLSDINAPRVDAPCLLIGDGARIAYEHLASLGIPCQMPPELLSWQTAYGVALAALHASPIPATELEPFYLRPSQAERERENSAR